MHATIEQILDIKDGIKTPVDHHVAECQSCQKALQEIMQMHHELNHLKEESVPSDAWQKIRLNSTITQNQSKSTSLVRAIYTLAASILIGSVIIVGFGNNPYSEQDRQYNELIRVMVESNTLENVIAKQITNGSHLVNSVNQLRIDQLKWRLMLIDQKIESLEANTTDRKLSLWQDRVRALEAIYDSFYNNQPPSIVTTGEI